MKRPVTEAAEAEFESPVTLMFGNLPGSALVSLERRRATRARCGARLSA